MPQQVALLPTEEVLRALLLSRDEVSILAATSRHLSVLDVRDAGTGISGAFVLIKIGKSSTMRRIQGFCAGVDYAVLDGGETCAVRNLDGDQASPSDWRAFAAAAAGQVLSGRWNHLTHHEVIRLALSIAALWECSELLRSHGYPLPPKPAAPGMQSAAQKQPKLPAPPPLQQQPQKHKPDPHEPNGVFSGAADPATSATQEKVARLRDALHRILLLSPLKGLGKAQELARRWRLWNDKAAHELVQGRCRVAPKPAVAVAMAALQPPELPDFPAPSFASCSPSPKVFSGPAPVESSNQELAVPSPSPTTGMESSSVSTRQQEELQHGPAHEQPRLQPMQQALLVSAPQQPLQQPMEEEGPQQASEPQPTLPEPTPVPQRASAAGSKAPLPLPQREQDTTPASAPLPTQLQPQPREASPLAPAAQPTVPHMVQQQPTAAETKMPLSQTMKKRPLSTGVPPPVEIPPPLPEPMQESPEELPHKRCRDTRKEVGAVAVVAPELPELPVPKPSTTETPLPASSSHWEPPLLVLGLSPRPASSRQQKQEPVALSPTLSVESCSNSSSQRKMVLQCMPAHLQRLPPSKRQPPIVSDPQPTLPQKMKDPQPFSQRQPVLPETTLAPLSVSAVLSMAQSPLPLREEDPQLVSEPKPQPLEPLPHRASSEAPVGQPPLPEPIHEQWHVSALQPPLPADSQPPLPTDLQSLGPSDLQPPLPTDLQPLGPSDLQPPLPSDHQPPLPSDHQPPLPTILQPPLPTHFTPRQPTDYKPRQPADYMPMRPTDVKALLPQPRQQRLNESRAQQTVMRPIKEPWPALAPQWPMPQPRHHHHQQNQQQYFQHNQHENQQQQWTQELLQQHGQLGQPQSEHVQQPFMVHRSTSQWPLPVIQVDLGPRQPLKQQLPPQPLPLQPSPQQQQSEHRPPLLPSQPPMPLQAGWQHVPAERQSEWQQVPAVPEPLPPLQEPPQPLLLQSQTLSGVLQAPPPQLASPSLHVLPSVGLPQCLPYQPQPLGLANPVQTQLPASAQPCVQAYPYPQPLIQLLPPPQQQPQPQLQVQQQPQPQLQVQQQPQPQLQVPQQPQQQPCGPAYVTINSNTQPHCQPQSRLILQQQEQQNGNAQAYWPPPTQPSCCQHQSPQPLQQHPPHHLSWPQTQAQPQAQLLPQPPQLQAHPHQAWAHPHQTQSAPWQPR